MSSPLAGVSHGYSTTAPGASPFDAAAAYERYRDEGMDHDKAVEAVVQEQKAHQYETLRDRGIGHDEALKHIEAGHQPMAPTRQEDLGDRVLGGARNVMQGATLGFGDEIAGLGAGAKALVTGGDAGEAYTKARDVERAGAKEYAAAHPKEAFLEQLAGGAVTALPGAGAVGSAVKAASLPVRALASSAVGAGTGAVAGFGGAEGSAEDQAKAALRGAEYGAAFGAAAPVAGTAVAAAAPKVAAGARAVGRLAGITTDKGRLAKAQDAIASAITNTGQSLEDVQSRHSTLVAAGRSPTVLETLGPAADDVLGSLSSLPAKSPVRGRAAVLAQQLRRDPATKEMADKIQAVLNQKPTPIIDGSAGFGGLARGGAGYMAGAIVGHPHIGAAVGIASKYGARHAASLESETVLERLLRPASDALGEAAPILPTAPLPRMRSSLPQVSRRTDGAWGPSKPPDPPDPPSGPNLTAALSRPNEPGRLSLVDKLRQMQGDSPLRPQQGATRAQLQYREDQFGLPKVAPDPPQGIAPELAGNDPSNLEMQLMATIERLKAGKGLRYP